LAEGVVRSDTRKLIAKALKRNVDELMAAYAGQREKQAQAVAALNGHHPKREIQTAIGPVTMQVPKIRSRQDKSVTFPSARVTPYVRKTTRLEAAISCLYLKGYLDRRDARNSGSLTWGQRPKAVPPVRCLD
jgi:transposase-like protein